MIKTGQVGNIVLGVGDPSKFNLLGGSFGQAGDYVTGGMASGARFLRSGKDRILAAAGAAGPYRGEGTPRAPRPLRPFDPNRYTRPR